MKILKRIAGVIVILLVVLAIVTYFAGGHMVKIAVVKGGEFALQVPVHLKGARLAGIGGEVELREFIVENPEGYSTPSAIEAGKIYVAAPLLGLLGSMPRVETISIDAPVITLEQGLTGSNLNDLMKNAQRFEKEEEEEEEGAKKTGKKGKRMVIGTLTITNAKVNLSTTLTKGKTVPLLIPPIKLSELGGADGVTIAQTIAISLREIVKSAVAQGGGMIPGDLSDSLNASIASFDQAQEQLMEKMGAMSDMTTGAITKTSGKAAEQLQETTKVLQDKTKGLLGISGKE